jgi:hypothetical protein
VANDRGVVPAEGVQQQLGVLDKHLGAVVARRLRLAVAALVKGDHLVVMQQARREVLPLVGVRAETVQEDDPIGTGPTPSHNVSVPAVELDALAAAAGRLKLARRDEELPRRHRALLDQTFSGTVGRPGLCSWRECRPATPTKGEKLPVRILTEPIMSMATIVTVATVVADESFLNSQKTGGDRRVNKVSSG